MEEAEFVIEYQIKYQLLLRITPKYWAKSITWNIKSLI